MRSMTGFGAGSAPLGPGRLVVEIRALNHKHQEVRVRMPSELHEHSFFGEQMARAALGRGRFDISVRIDGSLQSLPVVDQERLGALYASTLKLARSLDPDASVDVARLLSLPDMLKSEGPAVEEVRSSLQEAFKNASAKLEAMQLTEGKSMYEDLKSRLNHARELREAISAGSADLVTHHRQKLNERLNHLLGDASTVNPERLEHEVALLADRSDITEELVRLTSHFEQFASLLESSEPVGRRLDFLLQEVGREINTIGSKSAHAPVAHLVVDMKSEVERLREQVQNIS